MGSTSAPQPTGNAPKLAPFAEAQPFMLTEPPNVSWKVGDGLSDTPLGRDWKSDEELGWKTWDMAQTSPSDATQILNSTVIPRPIAFVSTLSAENKPNLAPFSFFSGGSLSSPDCQRLLQIISSHSQEHARQHSCYERIRSELDQRAVCRGGQ